MLSTISVGEGEGLGQLPGSNHETRAIGLPIFALAMLGHTETPESVVGLWSLVVGRLPSPRRSRLRTRPWERTTLFRNLFADSDQVANCFHKFAPGWKSFTEVIVNLRVEWSEVNSQSMVQCEKM